MRAALREPDRAHLRVGGAALAAARAVPAELLIVGLGDGEIERHPIDRHQPQLGTEGALAARRRERPRDLLVEPPQRLGPKSRPGLRDRHPARDLPPALPARRPVQALDQVAHHLLVGVLGKQRQGHRVADHHPCQQQPAALLEAPALGQHAIDQLRRVGSAQHPDRDVIGEVLVALGLDPSGPGHGLTVPGGSGHGLTVPGGSDVKLSVLRLGRFALHDPNLALGIDHDHVGASRPTNRHFLRCCQRLVEAGKEPRGLQDPVPQLAFAFALLFVVAHMRRRYRVVPLGTCDPLLARGSPLRACG